MNGRIHDDRPPAQAGRFYPGTPSQLGQMIEGFLAEGKLGVISSPKAIIAPHAGYIFSGPVAGAAFRAWAGCSGAVRRVVVMGPSHYVHFRGIALPTATRFLTPLGDLKVDVGACEQLRKLKQVRVSDPAHEREHCIEVELPFLQRLLTDFCIVPLVIGHATDQEIAEVILALWGGEETRFVLSSDLSHYLDYPSACRMDAGTAAEIESGRHDQLRAVHACGYMAIRGFLSATVGRGFRAEAIDLRNSGDTAGPRDRVVGYGAFAFAQP